MSCHVGVSISLNRPFTYNRSSLPAEPISPNPPLLDMHRQMDISVTSIRPPAPYSWDATFVQLDPGSAFRKRAPGKGLRMVALFWHCFLARNFKYSARRKERAMGRLRFFYLLSSVVLVAVFASSSSSSIFLLFVFVVAVAVAIRCCVRVEKPRIGRRIEPGSI